MSTFGPYPVEILDWHDGDTCHVNLDLGFGIHLQAPIVCRIYGINAPELKKHKTDPDGPGEESRDYANKVCPPGTEARVISHGWDKYKGRFDGALLFADGRDFASEMLAAGQAVILQEK